MQGVPGTDEMRNPWVYPGVCYQLGVPRRHPSQVPEPHQLASFNTQESSFHSLCPQPFCHYPQLNIGKGWNFNGMVTQQFCLPAQLRLRHNSQGSVEAATQNRPSRAPFSLSFMNKRCLNLHNSPQIRREESIVFQQRTMASEALILILSALHPAANHSSVC